MDNKKILAFLIVPLLFLIVLFLYLFNKAKINVTSQSISNKVEALKIDTTKTNRIKDTQGNPVAYSIQWLDGKEMDVSGIVAQSGLLEKEGKKYIRVFVPLSTGDVFVNAYFSQDQEQLFFLAAKNGQYEATKEWHLINVSSLSDKLKINNQVELRIILTPEDYAKLQGENVLEYNVTFVSNVAVIDE